MSRRGALVATAGMLVTVAVYLVVTLSLSKGATATAAGGGWPDLARRIAASFPPYRMNVTAGSLPARFVFPPAFRPALPVLGSTWWAASPERSPSNVHVYYAPSPRTDAVAKTLFAALRGAGYVHVAASGFTDGFVGESGPVQKWCPGAKRGPAFQINVDRVDGVPALDVLVDIYANGTSCSRGTSGMGRPDTPLPRLGDIPGMRIDARMRSSGGYENAIDAVAVVRTTLSARAAAAKLAQRFTAAGWTARPPVIDGTTVAQHFSRIAEPLQWDALLLLDRRDAGRFDAFLGVTHLPLPPARR